MTEPDAEHFALNEEELKGVKERKKKAQGAQPLAAGVTAVPQGAAPTPAVIGYQVKPAPYNKVHWKAQVYVYQCHECDLCLEDEGAMVLHIVEHAPEAERDQLLNVLTKNMKAQQEK